jgi:hypothetical protein
MLSEIKATSDTRLHQYESISSINSDNIQKYRSREKFQNSLKSINDNYEKFSNNNLINTHFPIANIQQSKIILTLNIIIIIFSFKIQQLYLNYQQYLNKLVHLFIVL